MIATIGPECPKARQFQKMSRAKNSIVPCVQNCLVWHLARLKRWASTW
jgi:hypothetical protein